jgi:hypothetical protein
MTIDETVDGLLADYQDGHSNFQIQHFIVGAEGPTPWGMYQQALRELRKRRDILRDLDLDLELARHTKRNRVTIATLLGWLWSPLRIRAIRAARGYVNLLDARDSTRREFAEFLEHARRLKAQLGTIDRDKLEAQQWQAKGRAMADVDLKLHGVLSTATMNYLICLPVPMQDCIVGELAHPRLGDGATLEARSNSPC